jgi:hypothetical protein
MVLDKTRDKTARLAPNVSYTKQTNPTRKAKNHNPSTLRKAKEHIPSTEISHYHSKRITHQGANPTKPKRKQTSKIIRYFKQHHCRGNGPSARSLTKAVSIVKMLQAWNIITNITSVRSSRSRMRSIHCWKAGTHGDRGDVEGGGYDDLTVEPYTNR